MNLPPDPKPTFEERMRAIGKTLDLVSRMQLKTEKEIDILGRYIRLIVKRSKRNNDYR